MRIQTNQVSYGAIICSWFNMQLVVTVSFKNKYFLGLGFLIQYLRKLKNFFMIILFHFSLSDETEDVNGEEGKTCS